MSDEDFFDDSGFCFRCGEYRPSGCLCHIPLERGNKRVDTVHVKPREELGQVLFDCCVMPEVDVVDWDATAANLLDSEWFRKLTQDVATNSEIRSMAWELGRAYAEGAASAFKKMRE